MKFTAGQVIIAIIAFLYFAMVTLLAIFTDGNTAAGLSMIGLLAVVFLGIFASMARDLAESFFARVLTLGSGACRIGVTNTDTGS